MFDPTVGVEGSRSSELCTTASNYAVQAYEKRSSPGPSLSCTVSCGAQREAHRAAAL